MSTHDISPSRVTREDLADLFAANVLRNSLAIPPDDRAGDLNLVVLLAPRTPAVSNSNLELKGMNLSGHCLGFHLLQVGVHITGIVKEGLYKVLSGGPAFQRSGLPAFQRLAPRPSRVPAFRRSPVPPFARSGSSV